MPQQFTIGLRGLLKPEVDKRASRQVQKDVEKDLAEVEELQPELDTSKMEKSLQDFDMGGTLSGDAGGGRRRRGGGGGASAAAAGGGLAGKAGGGLAKIALGGAVAIGMLGALNKIKNLTMASSPALQSTSNMFGEAMKLFFRPFGDFLSAQLRPFAKEGLKMAKNFNQSVGENGLAVAVTEGFTGIDFSDAGLFESFGTGFGAGGGAVAGGLAGAKAGGMLGAALGSVIPGAGTAAGGAVGAILGAIVGAISGSALGARIGGFLGEKIDEIEWGKFLPDISVDSVIGAIGWPEIAAAAVLGPIGWPSIGANILLEASDWPSIDVGSLLSKPNWPVIGATALLGPIGWPTLTAFNIVGAINWPTISAEGIIDAVTGGGSTSRPPSNGGTDPGGGGGGGDPWWWPFASGGIVTGPTRGLIGEAGPEAVIPLDRMSEFVGQDQRQIRTRGGSRDRGASGEDIQRLERKFDQLIREVRNLGGDVILQVDKRTLGLASTESTAEFQSSREVLK